MDTPSRSEAFASPSRAQTEREQFSPDRRSEAGRSECSVRWDRKRPANPWGGCKSWDDQPASNGEDVWHRGEVFVFRPERKHGFIKCEAEKMEIFVDAADIKGPLPRPRQSSDSTTPEIVEFRLNKKGPRPKAIEARVLKEESKPLEERVAAGEKFKGRVRWFAGSQGYIA